MGEIRRKLATPGNDPIDVTEMRRGQLLRQLEANLKPVLRERDYRNFDLQRAFRIAEDIARAI